MYRDAISFILLGLSMTLMLKSSLIKNHHETKVIRDLTFYLGIVLMILSTILLNVKLSDIVHTTILIVLFIIFAIIFKIKMKKYNDSIKILNELDNN